MLHVERKNSAAMSSRSSLAQDTSQRAAAEVQDQPIAADAALPTDASFSRDTAVPTDTSNATTNETTTAPATEEEPENTEPQDAEQQTEDPDASMTTLQVLQRNSAAPLPG